MFYVYVKQDAPGRSDRGWLNTACEFVELAEREAFDLEQVAAVLHSLDYRGCKLIEVKLERA